MKLLIFSYLLFFSSTILAQINTSYNHTYEGKMLFDTYQVFLEKEYNALKMPLDDEIEILEKGHYKLLKDSLTQQAYIGYNNKRIIIDEKQLETQKRKRIAIENVEYFKLGIDSFFVAKNILDINHIPIKNKTVKHIATFDSIVFASYKKNKNSGAYNVFLKKNKISDTTWKTLNKSNKLLTENLKMPFGELERFKGKEKITSGEFLKGLLELKYLYNLKNNAKFYYSNKWQELSSPKKASYYSKVTNKLDSIYTVEYYNSNHTKIYDVKYAAFNPNLKTEALNIYKDGVLTEQRVYNYDTLKKITTYLKDGSINYSYNCSKSKKNKLSKVNFYSITTHTGEKIQAPINGEFALKGVDKGIVHVFEDSKIVNCYYTENENKIYFFNAEKSIKIAKLETSLEYFINSKKDFELKKLKENLTGTILLDIITDHKGNVVSYEILNKLNNSLDTIIKQFCELRFLDNQSFKIKFKEVRVPDKSSFCRFVMPITFIYKRPNKTYLNPNFNHFLWQQQFLNQQFLNAPPVRVPSFNGF